MKCKQCERKATHSCSTDVYRENSDGEKVLVDVPIRYLCRHHTGEAIKNGARAMDLKKMEAVTVAAEKWVKENPELSLPGADPELRRQSIMAQPKMDIDFIVNSV